MWVERAEDAAVDEACRDATREIWSRNACGAWIALVQDCGEGHRCESGGCRQNFPEIEVSPTLLDFGKAPLVTTRTLVVNIGNVGHAALQISSVVIEGGPESPFSATSDAAVVAVDESVPVTVSFQPTAPGSRAARLLIHSDDEDEPQVTVLLNGTGVASR